MISPTPPYYAVIFTSLRTEGDNGYAEMAKHIAELAQQQPGFLGHRRAQGRAKEWYKSFRVRVCRVEREYGF